MAGAILIHLRTLEQGKLLLIDLEMNMDNSNLQKILSLHLSTLNEESLQTLSDNSSLIKCAKGNKLICEGKRHPYFYLVKFIDKG